MAAGVCESRHVPPPCKTDSGAALRCPERRCQIVLEVRETNLPAQLFFRSLNFRATSVLKDFYQDTTEDAYLMQYTWREAAAAVPRRMAG